MKKFSLIIFTVIISLFLINSVDASSASFSVSANKSRVIVGETVTVTVKLSSASALGSWQFDIQGSSNLTFVSSSFGGQTVKDYGNASTYSKTYTFVFKANSSGNASVAVVNPRVIDFNSVTDMSVTGKTVYFTNMTQAELEATYSKNNDLENLEVEGYTLSPEFDPDTLEYDVEVPNGVTSVVVDATKDDSTSTVTGEGTIDVIEGINVIELLVRAQNGSTKTYTINLTVKELDPIEVLIDNKIYTVIRKEEQFPLTSINYEKQTITIEDEEVPAAYNQLNNITLVALKDEFGTVSLFIYKDNTYTKYEEVVFNQLHIIPIDFKEPIEGFESTNVKIGDISVLGYKNENYTLIYGLNIGTGVENIYSYDIEENTIQRYIEVIDDNSLYMYIIIGLSSLLGLTFIILIINKIVKGSKLNGKLEKFGENETKINQKEENKIVAEIVTPSILPEVNSEDLLKEQLLEKEALDFIKTVSTSAKTKKIKNIDEKQIGKEETKKETKEEIKEDNSQVKKVEKKDKEDFIDDFLNETLDPTKRKKSKVKVKEEDINKLYTDDF